MTGNRTAKIDLLAAEPAAGGLPPPPPTRMSMDQLQRNFQAIQQARCIYYPVAYQFPRKLGQGRQGAVFLGLRQGARGCITEHAIKVFDPQIYRSPEEYWTDMGRIAAQISRLQRLQSPNIVTHHAYEETYGIGYVQMEAVDGVDVRSLLSRRHFDLVMRNSTAAEMARVTQNLFQLEGSRLRLRPGLVLYILRGILRGIERLHAMGFLHADVKPANVMIDRLGYVKMIDFGRAVRIGEELTFLLGSPLYMSIEMHRRQPAGPQSDLFSVGLVALEMLEGRPLTEVPDPEESMLLQLKLSLADELEDRLDDLAHDNGDLVAMVRKLLAPRPTDRYPSAKEADSGREGLIRIDKRRVRAGLEAEYERALADYLAKLVDPRTDRIELPEPVERPRHPADTTTF